MSAASRDSTPAGAAVRSDPRSLRALRWALIAIAAIHVPVGLALMLSHTAQVELAAWYGVDFDWTARDVYLVRILGSSLVVIGTLAASASRDPARNKVAIIALAEFFLLRNLQRHLFASELNEGFGVGTATNIATSAVFFALVGGLWLLYPRNGE